MVINSSNVDEFLKNKHFYLGVLKVRELIGELTPTKLGEIKKDVNTKRGNSTRAEIFSEFTGNPADEPRSGSAY